jgi:Protein of unknown function (DUF3102)
MQDDSNPNPPPAQAPEKRSRLIREKISQKVIDDINERHDRIRRSASEIAREVVELGQILTRVKDSMRHGKWLPFVEKNLRFTDRTATRYMRAAERIDDPLLSLDPAKFLAGVWGHEPKQIEEGKGVKKGKSDAASDFENEGEGEDDETGEKQHGGPGFTGLFPDKGKAALFNFKNLQGVLDREFFDSEDITLEAKLTFVTELTNYLESRRKIFSARLERQKEKEGDL